MEDIAKDILQQLELIRAFIFIIILILLAVFLFIISSALSTIKLNRQLITAHNNDINSFAQNAEDLLRRNESTSLLSICNERLESHPDDPDAQVFKARALYSAGNYHESKRCFSKALDLDPSLYYFVEVWLENIDKKLKENAPRIV